MSSDELFKRAMNELEVSFLLSSSNLEENLKDPSFVCNQMQLAHYRYIDFWRKNHPELPEIKKLEVFLAKMFEYSTIFCGNDPAQLVKYYSQYKSKIPVCGCILLNKDLTKMVLCRNINGECWMAPAGKINEGETLAECAVRETYEESGFDATNLIDENQCLPLKIGKKMVHMFIIPNVPDSFYIRADWLG
jgi:mRNA-decapping enzyme subunit 2